MKRRNFLQLLAGVSILPFVKIKESEANFECIDTTPTVDPGVYEWKETSEVIVFSGNGYDYDKLVANTLERNMKALEESIFRQTHFEKLFNG